MGHQSSIYVHTTVNALHHWPGAIDYEKRVYLSYPHMHTFHIEAHANVEHDDRDIEFHDLRELLDAQIQLMLYEDSRQVLTFGSRSCEAIGAELLELLPETVFCVLVSEDDECGAWVRRCDD